MTDESGQEFPATRQRAARQRARPARATTAPSRPTCTPTSALHASWQAIVDSAQSRDVPVSPPRQMLEWTDGRNESSFGAIDFNAGVLSFNVSPGAGANGLRAWSRRRGRRRRARERRAQRQPGRDQHRDDQGHRVRVLRRRRRLLLGYLRAPPPSRPRPRTRRRRLQRRHPHRHPRHRRERRRGHPEARGRGGVLRRRPARQLRLLGQLGPGRLADVSGGSLTVDGGYAGTSATYGSGRSLEFEATFQATPFTHIGFGVDYNTDPTWAMFSIKGDGNLYARTDPRQRRDASARAACSARRTATGSSGALPRSSITSTARSSPPTT